MVSIFTVIIFFFVSSSCAKSLLHKQFPVAEWPTLDGLPPLLFGHGGEKFYLPEHTTGSYKLAAIEGVAFNKLLKNIDTSEFHPSKITEI